MLAPELPTPPQYTAQEEEGTVRGRKYDQGRVYCLIAQLPSLCTLISQRCLLCAQNNARQGPIRPARIQRCGQAPFKDLEVDFTKIGSNRGNKYLLGFACTFWGWIPRSLACKVERMSSVPLRPTWKGPYLLILTTPTALRVTSLNTWIHHSWVKAAQLRMANLNEKKKKTQQQQQPGQSSANHPKEVSKAYSSVYTKA
ncbi:hypothetical protein QTO34_006267 [Cnephaeus nilssonii]|uniref:Murine leukemia virus integrase C-terminal domain-containing protein n=1 Tax=Cnephaeus nilssonii TaxID=3371016 RepID=A0AA40HMI7_CNENI|nr:hypothetical protein QTO34_006267 [Eptesicus nilssonii]